MPRLRLSPRFVGFLVVTLSLAPARLASQTSLSPEEKEHFLRHAKIVDSEPIGKGTTDPWRLTLSDGTLRHDAAFQYVDQRKPTAEFARRRPENNFRDSYTFNVAAWELAKLLGLEHMVPVTVERAWRGKRGALSWWVRAEWDEGERLAQALEPPDRQDWNRQMYTVRAFTGLIYDTDRNHGNMLITKDWQLWMIDFTRGFRRWPQLQTKAGLTKCELGLFERLKGLRAVELHEKLYRYLSKSEIEALVARRDLLIKHYLSIAAEMGDDWVFFHDPTPR